MLNPKQRVTRSLAGVADHIEQPLDGLELVTLLSTARIDDGILEISPAVDVIETEGGQDRQRLTAAVVLHHHRRQLSTRASELQHELLATVAWCDLTLTPRSNLHIHTDITTYSGLASFLALDPDSGPGSSWVMSMRDELDRLRHPVLPTDIVTHADPGSLGTHADGDHYSDDDDYSDDSDDDMPPLMDLNDDDYSNLGYTFVYPLPSTPMNE